MDWLECVGVGLRYELTGSGPETLVLVHEMGCTLESFDRLLPLLPQGLRVLRYDTRGAGLSTKLRGTADIGTMAGDIASLLAANDISGPVTLAGGAVGAAIALQFAALHPQATRGLVLFGPATGVPAERRQLALDFADEVEHGGMAAIVDAELSRAYPESMRGDAELFRRFRARWLANDPSSFAALFRMLAHLDMSQTLASVRCPVLLLAGTFDRLRPPERIKPLVEQLPNARFEAIASGHFAALQTPDLAATVLKRFLADLRT